MNFSAAKLRCMRLSLLAIVAAALAVAAGGAERAAPAATPSAGDDVRTLMTRIREIHPDPFHATPEATFQAAADALAARAHSLSPDELLVELMRFSNLLGERDGHSGIFPLDSRNRRVLHLFPLFLYKFRDGLFVVSAPGRRELVGSRLIWIGGIPADHVARPGGRARAAGAPARAARQRGDARRPLHELHADRRDSARPRPSLRHRGRA